MRIHFVIPGERETTLRAHRPLDGRIAARFLAQEIFLHFSSVSHEVHVAQMNREIRMRLGYAVRHHLRFVRSRAPVSNQAQHGAVGNFVDAVAFSLRGVIPEVVLPAKPVFCDVGNPGQNVARAGKPSADCKSSANNSSPQRENATRAPE